MEKDRSVSPRAFLSRESVHDDFVLLRSYWDLSRKKSSIVRLRTGIKPWKAEFQQAEKALEKEWQVFATPVLVS